MLASSTDERERGEEVLLQHDPNPSLGVLQPGDKPQLAASILASLVLVGVTGSPVSSPESTEIRAVQVSGGLLRSKDRARPRRQTDIAGALDGRLDVISNQFSLHLPCKL